MPFEAIPKTAVAEDIVAQLLLLIREKQLLPDYQAIVQALQAHDHIAAYHAMLTHLTHVEQRLREN
jgi:DNA-binding FadR family transcriptional regulator